MKYSNRHISDEELDQLFRDAHAAEGQEPLFVPEFWSEVEALLPPEKKNRGFLPWISVAAVTLLLLGLVWYPGTNARISPLENKQLVSANKEQKETPEANDVKATQETLAKATSSAITGQRGTQKPENSPVYFKPHVKAASGIAQKMNTSEEDEKPGVESENNLMEDLNIDRLEIKELTENKRREIEPLQNRMKTEENSWYLELGPTIGQSPYLSPEEKRNIVGGAVLGGGYMKKIDRAFVSLGVQARVEGFGGLNYRETNFSQNMTRTVSVKQLYSLEFPLRFGYVLRRSELSFGVVPGIQLFMHGKEQIIQNQVVQREGNYTGKVEHSNSMSMEFGFQYYYHLTPKYSIGAKFQADVLRPFHTDYYLGKLAGFPLNGQIVLRRTFSR